MLEPSLSETQGRDDSQKDNDHLCPGGPVEGHPEVNGPLESMGSLCFPHHTYLSPCLPFWSNVSWVSLAKPELPFPGFPSLRNSGPCDFM